jgi:hypothetical protein
LQNSDSATELTFRFRAVFLSFEKKIFKQAVLSVQNKILDDDIIELIIFSTCAEAYAIHATEESLPVQNRRDCLRKVGTLKQLIKNIGPPIIPADELVTDNGVGFSENRDNLRREAELCKDDIDLPQLQTVELDPDPDIFLETLTGMLKNELISYQSFAAKCSRSQIEKLYREIKNLKKETPQNLDVIIPLEKSLDTIVDAALRAEIEKNSKFEILNAEKITPHFVKLAKVGGGTESLSSIKNDTGEVLENDADRNEYITNHYRKLFKEKDDRQPLNANSIRDFLGEEICNNSIVKNSKLTETEKNLLDCAFSVQELDEAVAEAKSATAGGPDGLGNKCIKKLWPYIRIPLTNYANCCVQKGSLTDNFWTALIKLIPKKGDTGSINNWRPISLLNCMYKIR